MVYGGVGPRIGNDGSAGNTLEDLLGVSENNLKLPDWGEIELKTKGVTGFGKDRQVVWKELRLSSWIFH